MELYFRDRCHTPLTPEQAAKVVEVCEALADEYMNPEVRRFPTVAELDPALANLPVISMTDFREAEDDGEFADSWSIYVDRDPPPTAAQVRDTFAAREVDPDPIVLDRLATCRSTIVVEYLSRLTEHPFVLVLQRQLLSAIGPSVVESGEGTRFELSEAQLAALPPPRDAAAGRSRRKTPRPPRKARPGEIETVALSQRLLEAVNDPLIRADLQSEFAAATTEVRNYASLLLEDGAQSDAHAAKALHVSPKAVAAVRAALIALLERVSDGEDDEPAER